MTLALILAAVAPFADLDALDAAVARFAGAPAGAEGGALLPLDRRLRLRPCRSPAALSWRGERRETIVVECPDAGGWRLFVPVRAASVASGGLMESPAVSRGDAVTIAVSGQGFSVSQPGEAMDAGPVGGWIRVRATGGKAQPMRARIVRPGLVVIPSP